LREGVLGNPDSAARESFGSGAAGPLLEHPQYTRPADFRGHRVPEVLLGGNHQAIERWRLEQARARTWALRPDLGTTQPLPADTEVHLAVPAELDPSPELVDVARAHGVTGLVLIGADEARLLVWVEALRGRVKVTGFPKLAALRKRIRQRKGVEPWVIGLTEDPDARAATDPRVVLDTLAPTPETSGKALVLVLPGLPVPSDADAVFAPDVAPQLSASGEVATEAGIADASRPPEGHAALVDRTLRGLFESSRETTP
jgi:hypothetical protein